MSCHASANLELAIPNWVPAPVDDAADNAANRGTQMHEQFAGLAALSAKDMWNMAKAAEYVAMVRSRRRFKTMIEQVVSAEWLDSKPGTCADLVLYTQDELHIIDLKTGKIPVSAVENYQLMYYAVTYGPLAPKAKGAYLHIVQPWAGVMEEWYADAARLKTFMMDAMVAEKQILKGSTVFSPGDHCMFCEANPHGRGARGKPNCPAMMSLLYPQPAVDYEAMLDMAETE
jgi:hypothetical protein